MASSKKLVNSILGLRVLTLLVLAASIVVLGTNSVKFSDGSKLSFSDIHTYRYVVSVAGVGFIYTLIQLPFAIYFAATEKRWIKTGFLPEFDFYGDKVVSWILATGVGVGFGVTYEFKRFLKLIFAAAALGSGVSGGDLDEEESKSFKFFDRVYIATALLLAGFVAVAITSILTSIKRSEKGGFFR